MAGNSSELFEAIRSHGITTKTLERSATWSNRRLFSLVEELRQTTTEPKNISQGPFSFAANDSLSGRSIPFCTGESRVTKVAQLARFAALYADSLLLRDPFEWYPEPEMAVDKDGNRTLVSRGLEPNDFSNQQMRRHLIDDLRLLLFLEPLFASGIAGFSESVMHWCPNCVRAAADDGVLSALVDEPDEIAWQKRIAKLVRHIEKSFLERGTTLVHQHGDHAHATVFTPEGMFEYNQAQTTLNLPQHLAKKAIEPIKVSIRDARRLRLFNDEIDRIIDDISTQNATANRFNCQYITDRAIDLELMDMVSNKRVRSFNRAAVDALSHPLPFVDQVPLGRLLKLRKDSGESFLVYRDTVRSVLSSAQGKSSTELREAFDDAIRPELNKIDLTLKNARRQIATSTLIDLTIAFASVSIAAFSGLLPAKLGIPKEVLDVGAALGGWQSAKSLASKIAEIRSTPKEVNESKYAFLWKLRRGVGKL
ncbi:MAG TPA: hypothetical protein VJ842_20970 [Pyrinomonadaceae bacterium]|nr:hypothetical protein [Pyrinomonadaceae bacterium]